MSITTKNKRNWLIEAIKWLLMTDIHSPDSIIDTPSKKEYHKSYFRDYLSSPHKIIVSQRQLTICDQSQTINIFVGCDHIKTEIKYIYIIIEKELIKTHEQLILPHEQLIINDNKTILKSTYFEYYDKFASYYDNDTTCAGSYLSEHEELNRYTLVDKVDMYFYSYKEPSDKKRSLIYHSSSDNIDDFYKVFSIIEEKELEDYDDGMWEFLDKSTKWLSQTDIHPSVDLIEAPIALEKYRGNDCYHHIYGNSKIKISRRKVVISRGLYKISLFIGFNGPSMNGTCLFTVEIRPKKIIDSQTGDGEILKINGNTFIESTYFAEDYDDIPWTFCVNTVNFGKGPINIDLYSYDENLNNQSKSEFGQTNSDDNRSLIFHGSSDNIQHFIESFQIAINNF